MTSAAPEIRADRSSLQRVVDALGDRVATTSNGGDQLYARCPDPGHGPDRKPSLSVTWTSGPRGGLVKVNCFKGCDFFKVVESLGLRASDTFDTPPARPAGDDERQEREARAARQKRTERPKRPAPAIPTPAVDAEPVKTWGGAELVATHIYVSADGVPVFDVRRWANAPVKYTARSYTKDGLRISSNKMPKLERRELYRLPDLLAAKKAGGLVYVVEGEKDADSWAAVGVCATTNPGGAYISKDGNQWLPQYTEALRGAHVVLVADVDPLTPTRGYPGYRHVLNVASELEGVAASITVACPRSGKDSTDHLAAGYGESDLKPSELETLAALVAKVDQVHEEHGVYVVESSAAPAPATAPDPEPDAEAGGRVYDIRSGLEAHLGDDDDEHGGSGGGGGGNGGDGGGSDEEEPWKTVTVEDHFEAAPDGIFKVIHDRKNRLTKRLPLLSVPVKIVARYAKVLPDGVQPEASHYDLLANRQGEEFRMERVDLDRWERASWVNDMPWLIPAKRHQAGKSLLREAIEKTSGENIPLTPLYGALGWQEFNGRTVYVHAGGAIDANGVVDGITVDVPPELRRFELPEPPSTMEDLQRAVYASVEIMAAAPARISATMLGAAYRACLGFSQVTLFPVGSPYTGKSSLTSVIAQHYAPSSSFEDMAGVGAGEDAGTTNAIGDLRFLAGDVLFPLDDLAPDKGPEKAAERLNVIARSQYNRKGKVRMDRKTNVKVSHPPRCLPVVTGEQSTSMQSAETRLALVRFLPGDLDLTPKGAVAQLSTGTAPQDRAALIASMVRYYASRHPLTTWLSETRADLSIAFAEPNPDLTDEQRNADNRCSGIVADLAVGWRAMLDMATELGAITPSMAAELWASAWEGLLEAKRRMLDGRAGRTPADRLREMVNALLLGRRIALHSREGGTPITPEEYGWEMNGFDGSYRLAGEPVGWTDGKTVWLLPSSLFPHLERQANAEKEPMGLTKESMAQRLADAGVIKLPPREDGKTIQRNAVQRRMAGKPQWVWEVKHEWLFPPEEPDDTDPGKGPAPLPDAPTPPPAAPRGTDVPAPSSPRVDVAPEPATEASESAVEAPAEPVAPTRPRKPGRRVQGRTAAPAPASTYLTTWLKDQHPEATPEDLAEAERLWHESMRGIEFRGPFDTAKRILNGSLRHQSIPELPPLDQAQLAPVMVDVAGTGDLRQNWWRSRTRTMGAGLTEGAWVTSFDVNGFYPSAADIDLGTGDPVLTESATLPIGWQKRPGWVQLAAAATAAPYGLADRLPAGLWVPVPLAVYLEEIGALPAVKASLIWPEARRWLRTHVSMFREARGVLKELEADSLGARMAHRAVKSTNTRLFGGALRSEKHNNTLTLRVDWASMIESTAEARMYRALDKVDQTTARVIAKHVDAAWFEVASPDVVPAGLVVSDQYGKFKPVGCAQITPRMVEAHRVGRWKTIYDELEKSEGRK